LPSLQAAAIALIGLIAGMLGGMAGVGGSVFILPALHIVFSDLMFGEPEDREIHHLYMAAAMLVNVAVSIPAALQHHRERVVRTPHLPILIPTTSIAVIGGVVLSNFFPGEALRIILASFLILYCVWNLRIIARPRRRAFAGHGRVENASSGRLTTCGILTGITGGLLGLGGGFLMVPLLQMLCNYRLKNAIATSSAVLVVSAAVGAALKIATLPQHNESVRGALTYFALLAPTGIVGAVVGAKLLHHTPVTAVRTIMTFLILAAASRLIYQ
jgi:uncharacterized membrane protein YfcA